MVAACSGNIKCDIKKKPWMIKTGNSDARTQLRSPLRPPPLVCGLLVCREKMCGRGVHQLSDTNDAEGEWYRPVAVAYCIVHRVVATLVRVGQRRCWVPVGGHMLQSWVGFVDAQVLEEARDWRSLHGRSKGVHCHGAHIQLRLGAELAAEAADHSGGREAMTALDQRGQINADFQMLSTESSASPLLANPLLPACR